MKKRKINSRDAIVASRHIQELVSIALGARDPKGEEVSVTPDIPLATKASMLARTLSAASDLSMNHQNTLLTLHGTKVEGENQYVIDNPKSASAYMQALQDVWEQEVEIEPVLVPERILLALNPVAFSALVPVMILDNDDCRLQRRKVNEEQ